MSLIWKLFASHLAVIAAGLLLLALLTAYIAPINFAEHMGRMSGRGMMGGMMPRIQAELEAEFRDSLNRALLLTGAAATVVAAGISWLVSRRIVRPIRDTVKASQRIAAGHYDERLTAHTRDELGELTQSFNRMAAALADAEALRQQLIADVSHELKTPLASIKGYMEGLQDGVIAPTPETFQLVHREADRLQRLVHDLQELSRAEASQLQIAPRPCDAGDLVRAAVEWLRPQFEDKGVALTADLPAQPARVRADFDRARQVLLNLLGNALQYTPPGGTVTVRLTRADAMVQFSVRDTGVGLAAEDLERVFERFYRVDRSRARASGGSGIGLTIARHIVEAHGGRIWAESDGPGKGSVFHFTLPLA